MLGLTTISKMILETLQDSLDHLISGFRNQFQNQAQSVGRDGCVKECYNEQDMT